MASGGLSRRQWLSGLGAASLGLFLLPPRAQALGGVLPEIDQPAPPFDLAAVVPDARGQAVSSHRSLADDFGTSTRAMDGAVESLSSLPGVFGARMTGGGFGGCVVALCEAGANVPGWVVRPTGRAYRTDDTVNDHS